MGQAEPVPNPHKDAKTGHFLPGNNANPTGRPKGAGIKLSTRLKHLYSADATWEAIHNAIWFALTEGTVKERLEAVVIGLKVEGAIQPDTYTGSKEKRITLVEDSKDAHAPGDDVLVDGNADGV